MVNYDPTVTMTSSPNTMSKEYKVSITKEFELLLANRLVAVLTDKLVDMIIEEYYEKHSAQIMSKIPVDVIVNMAIAKMSARLANSLLDERRK